MKGLLQPTWTEANQRYLVAALGEVRAQLERYAARDRDAGTQAATIAATESVAAAAAALPAPAALEEVCRIFGLSSFERGVLLMCAGVELDASFRRLCAELQRDEAHGQPTLGLALAALSDAHWSALLPDAPLRRWRLIELGPGGGPTAAGLQIDERILHHLAGLCSFDDRLAEFALPVVTDLVDIAPSQRRLAAAAAAAWRDAPAPPVIQLVGRDHGAARRVAAAAAGELGHELRVMADQALLAVPRPDELRRRWEREARLGGAVLLLECRDVGDPERSARCDRFVEDLAAPIFVASDERRPLRHRPTVVFDVRKPTRDEQRAVWAAALGRRAADLTGTIDQLAAHFDLGAETIRSACGEVLGRNGDGEPDDDVRADRDARLARRLWTACRNQARPRLDDLARRVAPVAVWDDLVLPEPQRALLRAAALQVRHRLTVYERWGFAARSPRGLGLSALFAGGSGTGKTLAAEVLAHELDLDLYLIDLSQVVSKYIGETEKNLARVFAAAEEGGAVLLFDEADALFGKRSEVRDSHDRYANIEVSYLLQRMESYRGLAILTTNRKDALDEAFLRRIRFVVQFPFPDAALRAEIWRRIFPAATPTEGLDPGRLAQLNLTGGHIRNVALGAAFLAADLGEPVRMTHVLAAARLEYAKLEKPLTGSEQRGWP